MYQEAPISGLLLLEYIGVCFCVYISNALFCTAKANAMLLNLVPD